MTELGPHGGEAALNIHESSHDTFEVSRHKHWLSHNAGLGVYAHGRTHQQVGNVIIVSDLIHKRGYKLTDDILKMEEQALLSYGEPLSTNSRLGDLQALAVLPKMDSVNGEGLLVAYYDGGVVSFNTNIFPRETRHDGDGRMTQPGWDQRPMVSHLLNTVSAVGRNAVAVLPRDHAFRSSRGLHFLSLSLGTETYRSENVNFFSTDVSPALDSDSPELLRGSAVGFWVWGNRVFCTTGLVEDSGVSALPFGRGMAVFNQAVTYTDRSPVAAWEGLWVVHDTIAGVHQFVETKRRADRSSFGFIASTRDSTVVLGTFDPELKADLLGTHETPIEWSFETGQFAPAGIDGSLFVKDMLLEGVFDNASQKVRVSIRTDNHTTWEVWEEFSPCDKIKTADQALRLSHSVGAPPTSCKECSWFQVKVEGLGYAEITALDLDYSVSVSKMGKKKCVVIDREVSNFFEINDSPQETRWR